MSLSADQTVEALRAAGEPTRLRVLSLLAGEAAWQLRTLTRQTRRRWRGGAEGDYAPALRQWRVVRRSKPALISKGLRQHHVHRRMRPNEANQP